MKSTGYHTPIGSTSRSKCPADIPSGGRPMHRAGFTLVEMLVATGISILMLTLFLPIFQMATQSMTVQQGMSANDQKARMVQTMLRNDLNGDPCDKSDSGKEKPYRTFRNLVPYGANEHNEPNFDKTARDGYFYISENNPDNDADDVLQFTVATPDTATHRFYGRVGPVLADDDGNYGDMGGLGGLLGNLLNPLLQVQLPPPGNYWPDQPEFDDVQGIPNGVGSSTMAEISYFLRNGNLYRRVMLIRKPNVVNPLDDHSPADLLGGALSLSLYEPGGPRNYFTDYDFSAIHDGTGLRFHGKTGLGVGACGGSMFSLTSPAWRFGFDNTSSPGNGFGIPREHVGTNFIGRFTHAETSHPNFNFPGRIGVGFPNP